MKIDLRRAAKAAAVAAGTCALASASPAAAAGTPATVKVRVVGFNGTTLLPETQVTTTTTPIDADGHGDLCSGTSAGGALYDATKGNWVVKYDGASLGYEIDGIEGLNFQPFGSSPRSDAYWSFWLNNTFASNGACGQELNPGDHVVFFAQCQATGSGCPSATVPDHFLTEAPPVPGTVQVGTPVSVTVGSVSTATGSHEAALPSGVTVTAGSQRASPDAQGLVKLTFPTPGTYTVQASAPDAVPSDPQIVCVHNGDDGHCGTPALTPTTARVAGLRNGSVFALGHAPRLLHGTAVVGTLGLRQVELRLARRSGRRCQFLSGRTGRLRNARCGHGWLVRIGSAPRWSYLLAQQLAVGSYRLDVVPFESLGEQGRAVTVYFRVAAAPVLPVKKARAASSAAAPTVTAMVVGKGGKVLLASRPLRLPATRIAVPGAGLCALAAGTPLRVLETARRAGRLRYQLRRESSCDPSQLFVTAIDGQRNGGVAGWVYKVDGRAGTAGAADPAGPFGTGRRLRAGQRVLWFYCVDAVRCQATLAVRPDARAVTAGGQLGVTVLAVDDHGHSTPVVGATVTLGAQTATSAAGGRAIVTAPPVPRAYALSARDAGLVPSFPEAVTVQ